MNILFFGDVIGKLGRAAVKETIEEYKKEFEPDVLIANIENVTHGIGANPQSIEEMQELGFQLFTSGNHILRRKEIFDLLDQEDPVILRPGNFPGTPPGKGMNIFNVGTKKLVVINLIGQTFFREHYDSPFDLFDSYYTQLEEEFGSKIPPIFIDFHAEATSEKRAFPLYVDGKAQVVVGTHTHVPTADNYISEDGTAMVSDAGMSGLRDSVIGVDKEIIIYNMRHQVLHKSHDLPEEGLCQVNAVFARIDEKTNKTVEFTRADKTVFI